VVPATSAAHRVGEKVLALWGHKWFPGVVDDVIDGGGAYEIAWDDEDSSNKVPASRVRAAPLTVDVDAPAPRHARAAAVVTPLAATPPPPPAPVSPARPRPSRQAAAPIVSDRSLRPRKKATYKPTVVRAKKGNSSKKPSRAEEKRKYRQEQKKKKEQKKQANAAKLKAWVGKNDGVELYVQNVGYYRGYVATAWKSTSRRRVAGVEVDARLTTKPCKS
jgi:hypothetical protein